MTSLATAPIESEPTVRLACHHRGVDVFAWIVLAAAVGAGIVGILIAPRLKRSELRRRLEGGGGALGGIGAGFDSVWRPSAEDAHAHWEAQVELPAPAPVAGGAGRVEDGRIVIRVDPQD